MSPALFLVASYLIGALPSAYLAGRARGVDLREHGSGNLGATNTFRVLGAGIAIPVLLFDLVKGFIPVFLFGLWDGAPWGWTLAYGAAAIVGHIFPVYLGFRGGKGVATAAGVFLALSPTAVGVALLAWLGALAAWRTVSLASITAALTLAAALLTTETRVPVVVLGCAVSLFVVVAHRANIGRILRGVEPRIGRRRVSDGPKVENVEQGMGDDDG